ncbi:MAG: flagellar motor switch protein FliN [Fimbriimonadaceae bacterium]
MSTIAPEIIQDFAALQNQIWQTVSLSVSEGVGQNVAFGNPLTVAARTSDLYAEITAPMMVVQFCFSALPDSTQAILLPQETTTALAEMITGNEIEEIDDSTVSDVRPVLEAVVQGICLAAGQATGDTVVASGLAIRYQIFSMPTNLQRSEELARTQVAITGDSLNGSAIWLVDDATAHYLLGQAELVDITEELPFAQAEIGAIAQRFGGDDNAGIDRLLDIPLEISVELGRVKMLVKDVVELGTGSIVEIEKAAGEPVDVLVNGRLVARGEVVVIEDNFGVRVTEILNPQDRLNRLNEAA